MDRWFVDIVQTVLRRALNNVHDDVPEALRTLGAPGSNPVLASSPDVRVVDTTPGAATIEITGQQPLFAASPAPMVRIRAVISRTAMDGPNVRVQDWSAVVGDVHIEKSPTFSGRLNFGRSGDRWSGRGTLAIGPAGFGLDIMLRALSDMGLALGVKVRLPAPLPLGPTGLALIGVGGDFAVNFRPDAGPNPTALDYVRWARDNHDAWSQAPIDQSAVGIGINAGLGDVASNGFFLKLEPVGFLVLVPGPVFAFGGTGRIFDTAAISVRGDIVVDADSQSIAMGLGATIRYPLEPFTFLSASGVLEAFYSYRDPPLWFLHVGTRDVPIAATMSVGLASFAADAFLVMDRTGVAVGLGVDVEERFDIEVLAVWAKASVRVEAMVGWDPFQLEGWFILRGELGLSIFGLGFRLSASAEAAGRAPNPTWIRFDVRVRLDLPWPLPDWSGTVGITVGEDAKPPTLATPLRSVAAGGEPLRLAALHALTGRQWDLEIANRNHPASVEQGFPWPDVEIVIPFNQPVRDDTHTVLNPFPGTSNQGGYDVTHVITKIELRNVSADGSPVVTPLHGTWAGAADGSTGRLHLLATDPFAWLAPHTDVTHSPLFLERGRQEQRFDTGPAQPLEDDTRFGEVVIRPHGRTELLTDFAPGLTTRVVRSEELTISFETRHGSELSVDQLTMLVLAAPWEPGGTPTADIDVDGAAGTITQLDDTMPLYGDVHLVVLEVPVDPRGASSFTLRPESEVRPVLLVGVRYRPALQARWTSHRRTLLVPAVYELTIRGRSEGSYAVGDPSMPAPPDPESLTWDQTRRFEVVNPPSLRPYIVTTTIGDPRIFGAAPAPWDPTPVGVGFPNYRHYRPVVRFRVPYIHDIFDPLRARLRYPDGQVVQHDERAVVAADGHSSLPIASHVWIKALGGEPPTDEELVVTAALPASGPVSFSLSFPMPDGTREIALDEWAAYVSRYERFATHLAMPATSVTVFHEPGRTEVRDPCAVPGESAWPEAYPVELARAPAEWHLPPALVRFFATGGTPHGLGRETPVRFARFARLTGASFHVPGATPPPADPLVGLGDTVATTTVEVVSNGSVSGPVALWLRTPEPVDWWRVSGSLRIAHVIQTGACPSSLAFRRPLDLGTRILPGPDASSAFVIGTVGDTAIHLPRGVYDLVLRFDPAVAGRNALRPGPGVGATERVTLRFVQPAGLPWPRAAQPPPPPRGDRLVHEVEVPQIPPVEKVEQFTKWPIWYDPADPDNPGPMPDSRAAELRYHDVVLEADARFQAGITERAGAIRFARDLLTATLSKEVS